MCSLQNPCILGASIYYLSQQIFKNSLMMCQDRFMNKSVWMILQSRKMNY